MKDLKAKLFIPTILITAFCFAVISYLSYQQYLTFGAEAAQRTTNLQHNVIDQLAEWQDNNRELIGLLSESWAFRDQVATGDINRLLDQVLPFFSFQQINIINVYDPDASLMVCTSLPGLFGHSDELYEHVQAVLEQTEVYSVATVYDDQLALISFKRIEEIRGPVGVLAVGRFLDQSVVEQFSHIFHDGVEFSFKGELFISSAARASEAGTGKHKVTDFTVPDSIDVNGSLSLSIIENMSKAEEVFWQRFARLVGLFLLAGAAVIIGSRKAIFSVVMAIDDARAAAEDRELELREIQAELELRVQQRTRQLSESEERYREVVEGTGDLITQIDANGVFTYMNHVGAEILGVSPRDIVGMSSFYFIHPDDQARCRQWLRDCLVKGVRQATIENRQVNRETGAVSYMLWAFNFHYKDGELLGIDGIAHDITERVLAEEEKVALEEQLRHAHKMEAIGTLAGGIAHDFNNMLNAMLGYANLLLDELPAGRQPHHFASEIKKAGKQAATLIQQILTFSRRSEQEFRPLHLQYLVKETMKLLRGSLPSTITLQENINPNCGPVLAEATHLHQIVMNLCTNAYHAMRVEGGTLFVGLEEVLVDREMARRLPDISEGRYVRLTVTDSGQGIDALTLKRIFEPYFTTKGKGEGTGLGLATVHGIVQNHNGAISVESELERGSKFEVYLPIVEAEVAVAPEEPAAAVNLLPQLDCRVMFVDDVGFNVELGVHTLERMGCEVEGFTSSREALEVFGREPGRFDLVVTDQTMPELTGYELARQLLEIRPDIPIVMVTGHSETVDAGKAKAAGIREFLMKPLDPAVLGEAISNLCPLSE